MKSEKKIRGYDREFKVNAVNLYKTSGRSLKQIGEELGVPEGTLGGWIHLYQADKEEAFPGKGHLKPSDAEIARLTKELAIVREERDILKKALGIFSSLRK